MISASLEGRISYMTYPEPWGGPPKQPPEFLRPAPKPLPPIGRYHNGVSINTSLNGARLSTSQRSPNKYSSPPTSTPATVTQLKEEVADEIAYSAAYSRLYPPPPHFAYHNSGPYSPLYQPPYTPSLRSNYLPPPLSPLEPPYTPTTPSSISNPVNFLPSPTNYSPPVSLQQIPQTSLHNERKPSVSFKVPTGKEGSLKHRILTRPGENNHNHHTKNPIDLQKFAGSPKLLSENTRKRLSATISPPKSPAKPANTNIVLAGNFQKGAYIQLQNNVYRKIEDMRTEDFVASADYSSGLMLAESTVVKIEENPILGTATLSLCYNQRRTQVECEATLEHPFFVYGQGWASCSPDRTHQVFGLKAHRLQVGDILVSLTPREMPPATVSSHGSTIITTATTTAVTTRQFSGSANQQSPSESYHVIKSSQSLAGNEYYNAVSSNNQHTITNSVHPNVSQQSYLRPQSSSPDCVNSNKKRRWSAPEQSCDEDGQNCKKVKN